MNTHADSGQHPKQGKIRRASHKVVRTVAKRFQIDLDELRERRNDLLRTFTSQSERFVQDSELPWPQVVKTTLGRVNHIIDQWVDTSVTQEQRQREQALHHAVHQNTPDTPDTHHAQGAQTDGRPEGKTASKRKRSGGNSALGDAKEGSSGRRRRKPSRPSTKSPH